MRKDYVKKCICSAAFLTSSSFTSSDENECILNVVNKMLNEVWKVEYKSYSNFSIEEQSKEFWDTINTDLESEGHVYKFTAWYGESVNPPGQQGNVIINVQPNKSIKYLTFKLSIV